MRAVIQRVKKASVSIDNELYSSIDKGILILLGIEKNDTESNADMLAEKILNLRIFDDEHGKMNLSVRGINGELLVVSQFTITSDCKKGTRPSFDNAAKPEEAKKLYTYFTKKISTKFKEVKTGVFAAMMDVSLVNDGPVTFVIKK